jgi:hypothetical protein
MGAQIQDEKYLAGFVESIEEEMDPHLSESDTSKIYISTKIRYLQKLANKQSEKIGFCNWWNNGNGGKSNYKRIDWRLGLTHCLKSHKDIQTNIHHIKSQNETTTQYINNYKRIISRDTVWKTQFN